jgi:hypothetical protein
MRAGKLAFLGALFLHRHDKLAFVKYLLLLICNLGGKFQHLQHAY